MFKKSKYLVSAFALILGISSSTLVHAQNSDDLLRYSQLNTTGNARYTAMGGAFGALGGNSSALGVNPAGIGLFSRGELSMTTALNFTNQSASYLGTNTSGYGTVKMNVPQAALIFPVWEGSQDQANSWRRIQMGVTIVRTNDFNSSSYIKGFNTQSSYAQFLAARSNGISPNGLNPYYEGLAYENWLLDNNPKDNSYTSIIDGGNVMQKKIINTWGGMTDMNFTIGGNYSDKLYLGATIRGSLY